MILDTSSSQPSTHRVFAVTEVSVSDWSILPADFLLGDYLPGILLSGPFPITLFKIAHSHIHPTRRHLSLFPPCFFPPLLTIQPTIDNQQNT